LWSSSSSPVVAAARPGSRCATRYSAHTRSNLPLALPKPVFPLRPSTSTPPMADRRDRLRAVLASGSRDHADLTSFTAEDLTELPLDNYHNTALAYAIEHRAHGDTIRHLVIVRGCSLESVNRNMCERIKVEQRVYTATCTRTWPRTANTDTHRHTSHTAPLLLRAAVPGCPSECGATLRR
jgi:hypothetical protein